MIRIKTLLLPLVMGDHFEGRARGDWDLRRVEPKVVSFFRVLTEPSALNTILLRSLMIMSKV